MLCGGVIGDCLITRFGGSVGRRTAGTYKGDFGGLSVRVWTGRGSPAGVRGEVGEELWGVAFAELAGDMGCDCVPYGLCCVGEEVYGAGPIEGAGIANSVAIVNREVIASQIEFERARRDGNKGR
jgi:hypothetical protein